MATNYEIRLYSPTGTALASLNQFSNLECALVENDVSVLTVTLPPIIPFAWLRRDAIIQVIRSVDGSPGKALGSGTDAALWFIKKAGFTTNNDTELMWFTAYDAKVLLKQRVVEGYAGAPTSSKSGYLDNIMRQIVRENMGSIADTGLDINRALGAGFWNILTIEGDNSSSVTGEKAFAHREVMPVLQDLANQSADAGVYLSFDITHQGWNSYGLPALLFQVFKGQRGVDRGATSPNRLVFSRQYGTITETKIENDWTIMADVIKAGGAGDGAARIFEYASDNSLVTESPFGRVEDFIDRNNITLATSLQAEAQAQLRESRPRLRMTGTLMDTPSARFGVHYNHGDIVTIEEAGTTFSARLSAIRITMTDSGEKIDAKVNTETII